MTTRVGGWVGPTHDHHLRGTSVVVATLLYYDQAPHPIRINRVTQNDTVTQKTTLICITCDKKMTHGYSASQGKNTSRK